MTRLRKMMLLRKPRMFWEFRRRRPSAIGRWPRPGCLLSSPERKDAPARSLPDWQTADQRVISTGSGGPQVTLVVIVGKQKLFQMGTSESVLISRLMCIRE